jgi:8-oxo-dGTP diphosphatase
VIHVVAAALVDPAGRVLLAQRHPDSHQGGLWEFPGGKLEPGEPVLDALVRELQEELGVTPRRHRPLIRITHHYEDLGVLLDVHRVDAWDGEPHGREGQPLAWVSSDALDSYPMPAADRPIVRALQLPDLYLITPPALGEPARFLANLEKALAGGVRLVQLRLFDLPREVLIETGSAASALCHRYGARVLVNGSPELALESGADGVHLNSRDLRAAAARPVGSSMLLAASCHDAGDLAQAVRLGADLAVLSPVLPTRSHPDAEPLGWDGFAALVESASVPVFALGGMRPDLRPDAWAHGGQGIAGIRGLWPEPLDG